jgi:hypothetical protein
MHNTDVDHGAMGPAEAEAIAQGLEAPEVARTRHLDALDIGIASIRSVFRGAVI